MKTNEIPSQTYTDIQSVQLLGSLFYKSAENQFWEDRKSELWQYAFSRLLAPDLLTARGLNPKETIKIYPRDWFEDLNEDESILFSLSENRYSLVLLNGESCSVHLEFDRDTVSLTVSEELSQSPVLKQKTLLTTLVCTRIALEYTKLHGVTN